MITSDSSSALTTPPRADSPARKRSPAREQSPAREESPARDSTSEPLVVEPMVMDPSAGNPLLEIFLVFFCSFSLFPECLFDLFSFSGRQIHPPRS